MLISETLLALNSFKSLEPNWDEMGALAPSLFSIREAEFFVQTYLKLEYDIYHVAPGPNGEILIHLKKNDKSLEIVFYPDRIIFAKFDSVGGEQHDFTSEGFFQAMDWLKSDKTNF